MSTDAARNFRYRYDLDGLRGIAIALVVFYHVFVGRVSGGVDVFLLLSGYFFLGSQLRYAGKPNASLNPWWPIWRTLRRLLPALILVIGVTTLLVYFVTPQLMRTEFTQQITATLFYYQNWELARQDADYAAASADTSPLQHMWSMAVQGQFYLMGIIFALLLASIMRFKPTGGLRPQRFPTVNQIAGPILIIITIVSFAYASRHGLFGTGENYYSTWSRAWELTLGAVLAIYGSKIRVSVLLGNIMCVVGLLALFFTGAIIADSTAYPGPLSLLPLGGAVLIIIGGGAGGKMSGIMASKTARWFGDIAYSLYLWHWPLLILSTSALGLATPPWWLGVIIIAVSLLLADLTHRFIEKPLRQRTKRPMADDMPVNHARSSLQQRPGQLRAVGGAVVAASMVALLMVQPMWLRTIQGAEGETLDPATYPGVMAHFGADVPEVQSLEPDPILVGGIMPPVSTVHCFIAKDAPADFFLDTDVNGQPCIFGDADADYTVYLVGGSHAEQWSSGLDKLGKQMGFKLVPLLRQDCPIELGDTSGVTPVCAEWGELAMDKILEADPDLVISNTTRPQGEYGHGPDMVPAGYAGFWEGLAAAGIPFMGLRDNPWSFDEEGMAREFDECFVATEDPIGCGMARERVYTPFDPAEEILSNLPNMVSVDTSNWFCDATWCPVVIGNTMVYRDMHHISNAFADSAMPLFADYIGAFMAGEPMPEPREPSFDPAPNPEPGLPGNEYPGGEQAPVEMLPGEEVPPVYQDAPPAEEAPPVEQAPPAEVSPAEVPPAEAPPAVGSPEGAVPYEPAPGEFVPAP
ncbi:acyltransferase family protein [Corynebacterium sp. L4756]|uniref:acyltransferase family protein n=1 Tax=unclassified Corynebacterium TaxID=2624378 RepID=UPI00374CAD35